MGNSIGKLVETTFHTGMVAIVILSALPMFAAPASTHAQTATRTINGFEVAGRFLDVWSKQGSEQSSVYVNGLPITARRSEISVDDGKAYDTQWFERARYEAHPENVGPNDVLLGRLGASRVEGRGKLDSSTGKVANPGDEPFLGVGQPSGTGTITRWFPETRHTLSGKLLEYWERYGGLSQFGFPLSEPFLETSQADGKVYTVQYFERNRMELHPEKAAPYDVELGLLGVEQYRARAIPAAELPVAPPKDMTTVRDEIKIGMSQEPSTLLFSSATLRIRSLIEDQLVGRDDNDNLFPLDAWYVPTLENGGAYFVGSGDDRHLTVKYKLRRGIKWSDGVELTSNDAAFAYKLIMNPDALIANRAEYEKLQNMDNPDKYTVIYNYKSVRQAAAFLKSVRNPQDYSHLQLFADLKKPVISRAYAEIGAIYPEHALSKIPLSRIVDNPIARAPIGTGPYKVSKWTAGQEMVLVPNEHYALTSTPLIKKIVLKFIQDSNQLFALIKTGGVDMIASGAFTTIPADTAALKAKGINAATSPAVAWEHIDFYTQYGPFKERVVREAIITAINRQRIIDVVYPGSATITNGPVPSGFYYSLENPSFAGNYPGIASRYKLPTYPYDRERAKKLLDDAGWKVGPDGIRAKGDEKLSFGYVTTAIRQHTAALVQADLKAVGIDMAVPSYSLGCMSCPLPDPFDWKVESFKLRQIPSQGTRDGDFAEWVCERVGPQPEVHLENAARFCDPNVKAANDRFKTEAALDTRLEAAAQAQALLMQNISMIPLVQRPNIELVTNKLSNYKLANSTIGSFWNARQWYFK